MATSCLTISLWLLAAFSLLPAPTLAHAQPVERPRESGPRLDVDLDLDAP